MVETQKRFIPVHSGANELKTVWEGNITNMSLVTHHGKERDDIKTLIKRGCEVHFSKTDSWVYIDGRIFNGVSRRIINKIKEEIRLEESSESQNKEE